MGWLWCRELELGNSDARVTWGRDSSTQAVAAPIRQELLHNTEALMKETVPLLHTVTV